MSALTELLKQAREKYNKLSPEERRILMEEQAKSFVAGEAAFGSDKDELAYKEALNNNDQKLLNRLKAESQERMRKVKENTSNNNLEFNSDKVFYLIWNFDKKPPKYIHYSYAEALTEAKRLAKINPGEKFFIVTAISYVSVEEHCIALRN